MFTQRQKHLDNALLSAVAALLLLTASAQSAMMTNNLQTTATPALLNSSLTTQLNNGSMEEPRVLRSQSPCRSEHENFCENGGTCMYPQDNEEPSCTCTSSYTGKRCMFFLDRLTTTPDLGPLIAAFFGVAMLFIGAIVILVIIIYFCVYKRCKKSISTADKICTV